MASVCRCGHDFGVDGGGGHAGQHHGGTAGQLGELGHQARSAGAIGQGGGVVAVGPRQLRGLVGVEKQGLTVGASHGQGGGPRAGKDFFGEEGHAGVGADVEKPASTGSHGIAHLFGPVNGRDHDLGGDFPGQFLVESGLGGPQHHLIHGRNHCGMVESYLHVQGNNVRTKGGATAKFVFHGFGVLGGLMAKQVEDFTVVVGATDQHIGGAGVA